MYSTMYSAVAIPILMIIQCSVIISEYHKGAKRVLPKHLYLITVAGLTYVLMSRLTICILFYTLTSRSLWPRVELMLNQNPLYKMLASVELITIPTIFMLIISIWSLSVIKTHINDFPGIYKFSGWSCFGLASISMFFISRDIRGYF